MTDGIKCVIQNAIMTSKAASRLPSAEEIRHMWEDMETAALKDKKECEEDEKCRKALWKKETTQFNDYKNGMPEKAVLVKLSFSAKNYVNWGEGWNYPVKGHQFVLFAEDSEILRALHHHDLAYELGDNDGGGKSHVKIEVTVCSDHKLFSSLEALSLASTHDNILENLVTYEEPSYNIWRDWLIVNSLKVKEKLQDII